MDSSQNLLLIFCTALGINEKPLLNLLGLSMSLPSSLMHFCYGPEPSGHVAAPVRLGQPDHVDDPQGTHTTAYLEGLQCPHRNILLELGWTQLSYFHKSTWYEWAATAAAAHGLTVIRWAIYSIGMYTIADHFLQTWLHSRRGFMTFGGYQIFLGTVVQQTLDHACCSFRNAEEVLAFKLPAKFHPQHKAALKR